MYWPDRGMCSAPSTRTRATNLSSIDSMTLIAISHRGVRRLPRMLSPRVDLAAGVLVADLDQAFHRSPFEDPVRLNGWVQVEVGALSHLVAGMDAAQDRRPGHDRHDVRDG